MKKHLTLTIRLVLAMTLFTSASQLVWAADARSMLQGYEWQPEGVDWSETTVADLRQLIESEHEPLFIRRRAIAAIALIESADAAQTLIHLAQDTDEPNLQRRAIDEVCRYSTAESWQGEVVSLMIDTLDRPDAMVRFRAAKCLEALSASARVKQALEAYYALASEWERSYLTQGVGFDESSN